jgi:hypothetical protein
MTLGRHLYDLWRLRKGLVISLCLAVLAAGYSAGKLSLFPPGVKPRPLTIAAASTSVLVDAPQSALSLVVNTQNIEGITNKALLVGNVMASPPVKTYIMREAHLPARIDLQIISPVTLDYPRQLTSEGTKSPTDILKAPDQYRLLISANPTVPVLTIDSEAPSAAEAGRLANAAVAGMQDYLRDLGAQENLKPAQQVTLRQLGAAQGVVTNPGVNVEAALLTFFLVFVASAATTLWLARVREGWQRAGERPDGSAASA